MRIDRRAWLMVVVVAAACVVAMPVAQAAPPDGNLLPATKRLGGMTAGQLLGEETRLLVEFPVGSGPLGGGDESCFSSTGGAGVLIVWTRFEDEPPAECVVKPGTPVFLFGAWVFCDEVEDPPFFAVGEEEQRECALQGVETLLEFDAILVSVDGGPAVDIGTDRYLAVSPQGTAQLPEDNIFGVDPQQMTFVTAGYVAMLRPLAPGEHTITVEIVGGPFGGATTSATISVVPGA